MAEVKYIEYRNKVILHVDFSGALSSVELEDVMDKASKLLVLNRNKGILVLYNLEGVTITSKFLKSASSLMVKTAAKVRRRAYVSTDPGVRRLVNSFTAILNLTGNSYLFETETDALNCLVDDEIFG
jgi:hypothetical protein